ncbi:hypothetical protein QTP86_031065 [Hemibagrus guttatus]|nr:hypothetical protein QTP86_031065 [Hemibagrus guttatus]
MVGLISKNDESAYREEVQRLTAWCKANNLSLNVEKTKEMSTKFLGVHLAEDLTWSLNTSSITKKAQQRLYFLQRLRKAHLPPPILTTFYRGTIESILSTTAWFGNCTILDRMTLQRIENVGHGAARQEAKRKAKEESVTSLNGIAIHKWVLLLLLGLVPWSGDSAQSYRLTTPY